MAYEQLAVGVVQTVGLHDWQKLGRGRTADSRSRMGDRQTSRRVQEM